MTSEMKTDSGNAASGRRGFLARFGRDQSGSVAVEFVLLALPFSLLVFAILESCIAFAGQQVLSNAADDLARQFRTGQIRPSVDLTPQFVRDKICAKIDVLVAKNCPELIIDLQSYTTFAEASKIKIKFTSDGDIDTTGFGVNLGRSQSNNVLRVFYRWPVITDFMRSRIANMKGRYVLQFAAVTWRNEPFND